MSSQRLTAMPRDASWVDCPDTTKTKKYHIVDENERPACGTRMVANDDMAMWADHVPLFQRCQRRGCREKWPAAEKE